MADNCRLPLRSVHRNDFAKPPAFGSVRRAIVKRAEIVFCCGLLLPPFSIITIEAGIPYMIEYRPAKKPDKEAIDQILESSFSKIYAYYAKKSFASLENALVAESDVKVIGVINWRVYKASKITIGYLFWLGVLPEYRRKGIGSKLTKRAVDFIYTKNGPVDIYSAAEKKNKISKNLVEKEGFVEADKKKIKQYYGKNYKALFGDMMVMPWESLFVKHPAGKPAP